ncbi:MAG: c-type cytochrome [Rhodocyclaceae bacterium]
MSTHRTPLHAIAIACVGAIVTAPAAADDAEMLALAERSRCLNCHEVAETIRGPAWVDVAQRYRDDPEALERLVDKVRNGGSGAWGDDYMSPNKRVKEEDIRRLVGWILELE